MCNIIPAYNEGGKKEEKEKEEEEEEEEEEGAKDVDDAKYEMQ